MSRPTIPAKRPAEAQEAAWVAEEDRFVLQQAKKKAAIRAKSSRAQPLDWLAVTLAIIDPERNPLDDEVDMSDLDLVDPEAVFEGLDASQLGDLEKGIETYVALEHSRSNLEYWNVSLLYLALLFFTDTDRPLDYKDSMSRPAKASASSTALCERRQFGHFRFGQTFRSKESRRTGEARAADQGEIVFQRSHRHRLLGAFA